MASPNPSASPSVATEGTPLAVGWWIVAAAILVLSVTPDVQPWRAGVVFGTLIAHAVLASAWFALRPGRLGVRFLGLLAWSGSVFVPLIIKVSIQLSAPSLQQAIGGLFAMCLMQVLVITPPFWILRWFGFLLSRQEQISGTRRLQFGVRHLLIFTPVIAVILAGVRLVGSFSGGATTLADFARAAFGVLAAVFATMPVLLAMYLRRHTAAAVAGALLLGAAILAAQVQVTVDNEGQVAVHLVHSAWVILISGVFRHYGFRLTRVT